MAITVINQPIDFIGNVGDDFGFCVDAETDGAQIVYQWQFKRPDAATYQSSSMPGNKTPYMHSEITSQRLDYKYRCRMNESGSTNYVYTEIATIKEGTTPPVLAQLKRLWGAKAGILAAISGKGVTVAPDASLEDFPALIAQIGS